jgi:translocation and assembly module TamA
MNLYRKFLILLLLFGNLCFGSISYTVQFQGLRHRTILKEVKTVSQLLEKRSKNPLSLTSLRRRADTDIPRVLTILHNHGYYNAHANYFIESLKNNKAKVVIDISMGPLFFLRNFQIENYPKDLSQESLGLELNKAATARAILNSKNEVLERLKDNGYPFATIDTPKVQVDRPERSIYVDMTVNPGPKLNFGNTTVKGLVKVERAYIDKKTAWREGQFFSERQVYKTQKALEKSNLFESVSITYGEPTDEKLPIFIDVTESKHRSIGCAVSYTSHKGVGLQGDWQHRNIRHMGDLLSLSIGFADRERTMRAVYTIYDFCRYNQKLNFILEEGRETSKAYKNYSQRGAANIERKITKSISLSLGVDINNMQTSNSDNNRAFLVFTMPATLHLDNTNRIFHPTMGYLFYYKVAPSIDLKRTNTKFLTQQASLTLYKTLIKRHDVVGLLWLNAGSIMGPRRQEIPPPYRFYGGSEDTLRGYKYHTVSPLSDNKPIGGCSMFIYGLELRTAVSKDITTGPFFEQGNVFSNSIPVPDKKLLRSWGWQVRFATPIGSLSTNIAFPLDRRSNIDNNFQIYITIGRGF